MSSPEPFYTIQVGTGDLAAALVQREVDHLKAEMQRHRNTINAAEDAIEQDVLRPVWARLSARFEAQWPAMDGLSHNFSLLTNMVCTLHCPPPPKLEATSFWNYISSAKNVRSMSHGARWQLGEKITLSWRIGAVPENGPIVVLYSAELRETLTGREVETINGYLERIEQVQYDIYHIQSKLDDLPGIEREARARLTETFLQKQPELLAQLDAVFPRMLSKGEAP